MPRLAAAPLPRACLLLAGVLLLALALRVWGLGWGLPSATHYFSYHPDESVVLEASSLPTMNVFTGQLLPHFYRYGSLQLYLVCFANTLAALAGAVDIVPKDFAIWYPQWAKMYLIGRCLTVGMGVGTVFAVYRIGERLWGRRAGLMAALALAVMPLHAQHSHFLTVDVPATFWAMLSLLWAVRLATDDSKPLRAALWAGAFAGLAAATKYNLALAVLPLVVAVLIPTPPAPNPGGAGLEVASRSSPPPVNGGRGRGVIFLGLAAFVFAFFLACPGAILENAQFMRDLRFEAVHVQNVDDPTFRDTGSGFVYHIARNLDAGLGLPLLVLALVSVGYALYKHERGDGLLAAFALPYYVLISLAAVRYARYTIPLLPILALWVGRMAADWSRLPRPTLRWFGMIAGAGALAWTLVAALWLVEAMAETDSRDEALTWIRSHAAASATFGFAAMPWFGTAPISPYFPMYQRGGWRAMTPPTEAARYVYAGKDWDLDLLKSANPDFVILSEYDYADAQRRGEAEASAYLDYLTDAEHAHPYYEVASYNYDDVGLLWRVRQVMQDSEGFHAVSLPTRDLPHDMLYPSPTITIYSHTPPQDGARKSP